MAQFNILLFQVHQGLSKSDLQDLAEKLTSLAGLRVSIQFILLNGKDGKTYDFIDSRV